MSDSAAANDSKSRAIIEEILGDARKKAARGIKKAEKEASQVIAKASVKAEELKSEILDSAETKGTIEANKILAGTNLDIKRMRLEKQDLFLRGVIEKSLLQLESLSGEEALQLLLGNLKRGLAVLQEKKVIVELSPTIKIVDIEPLFVEADVEPQFTQNNQLAESEVVLSSLDNSVRYEAVYRTVYSTHQERFLRELYQVFFGREDG